MLYDASRLDHPTPEVFDPAAWQRSSSVQRTQGGRGTVAFIEDGDRRWVLRHYRRGGLLAGLLGDRYFWAGEDRSRSFREWRLLARLADWSLPVPRPVAAGYSKTGLSYRADLITEELPTRRTLAMALASGPLEDARWRSIGSCIARFHALGVQHADLNAHNVLLGDPGEVFLLDFDRGRIRERGAWERTVLARLRRSLEKVTAALPPGRFGEPQWLLLLAACEGD
jgi:3-deoxy-D-manno-octulosonic acid kinase